MPPLESRDATLQISDVSRTAGVSVSTVRVWEAQGLLTPTYTASGRRAYRQADVETAISIKHMRATQGMKISEIKSVLANMTVDVGAESQSENGEPQSEFGAELRRLRLARKLTIKAVAKALDVDASLLASVERTSLGIDIPLLKRLSSFYDVTLEHLMGVDSPSPDREIVMREHGVVLPRLGLGVVIERLGSGQDMMDCQRWRVDPGIHSNGSYRHEGEEFLSVVSGAFEITIDNSRVHVLTAGDTMYFRSNMLHAWRNPSNDVAEVLWICVGNTF